jgi:outer membrane protein assembly factor BamD
MISLKRLVSRFGVVGARMSPVLWVACEPPPISTLSAEEGITRIRGSHQDASYERVIQEVDEYKSRYPYSQYAKEAEMLQADAYFNSRKFTEAIVAYEEFLRRNPSDEKVPFAHFRVASSYDKQAPEEEDREQYFTQKALDKYALFIENYKNSGHWNEAKERFAILKRRLADHHHFVASFYFRKEKFEAALGRYLFLEKNYPEYAEYVQVSREKAAICYQELANELEQDPKSDLKRIFLGATPESLRKMGADLQRK